MLWRFLFRFYVTLQTKYLKLSKTTLSKGGAFHSTVNEMKKCQKMWILPWDNIGAWLKLCSFGRPLASRPLLGRLNVQRLYKVGRTLKAGRTLKCQPLQLLRHVLHLPMLRSQDWLWKYWFYWEGWWLVSKGDRRGIAFYCIIAWAGWIRSFYGKSLYSIVYPEGAHFDVIFLNQLNFI